MGKNGRWKKQAARGVTTSYRLMLAAPHVAVRNSVTTPPSLDEPPFYYTLHGLVPRNSIRKIKDTLRPVVGNPEDVDYLSPGLTLMFVPLTGFDGVKPLLCRAGTLKPVGKPTSSGRIHTTC